MAWTSGDAVLALAGTNVLVALVFVLIYAAAGTRWMTQGAFLAGLVVFFAGSIALWVRVERPRSATRDPITRIGRVSIALIAVVVGLPAFVLAPLLGLQETLPPAAGFSDVVRPVMVLLLISLIWVCAVNVAGAGVLAATALWAVLTRRSRPGP